MSKLAATFHGADCTGACCRNPYGTCYHGRACKWHLKQEADRIKFERERSAEIEFRKAWM